MTDKKQKSKVERLNVMPINTVDVVSSLTDANRLNAQVPGLQSIIASLNGSGSGDGGSSELTGATPLENAEVVFLGTASSIPGTERNVSAILLNIGINADHVDHNGTCCRVSVVTVLLAHENCRCLASIRGRDGCSYDVAATGVNVLLRGSGMTNEPSRRLHVER